MYYTYKYMKHLSTANVNIEKYSHRIDNGTETTCKSCDLVLDLGVHSKLGHQMHVTEIYKRYKNRLKEAFYFLYYMKDIQTYSTCIQVSLAIRGAYVPD